MMASPAPYVPDPWLRSPLSREQIEDAASAVLFFIADPLAPPDAKERLMRAADVLPVKNALTVSDAFKAERDTWFLPYLEHYGVQS
jgi:hypothetical protein